MSLGAAPARSSSTDNGRVSLGRGSVEWTALRYVVPRAQDPTPGRRSGEVTAEDGVRARDAAGSSGVCASGARRTREGIAGEVDFLRGERNGAERRRARSGARDPAHTANQDGDGGSETTGVLRPDRRIRHLEALRPPMVRRRGQAAIRVSSLYPQLTGRELLADITGIMQGSDNQTEGRVNVLPRRALRAVPRHLPPRRSGGGKHDLSGFVLLEEPSSAMGCETVGVKRPCQRRDRGGSPCGEPRVAGLL